METKPQVLLWCFVEENFGPSKSKDAHLLVSVMLNRGGLLSATLPSAFNLLLQVTKDKY